MTLRQKANWGLRLIFTLFVTIAGVGWWGNQHQQTEYRTASMTLVTALKRLQQSLDTRTAEIVAQGPATAAV